ncbi:MAG: relaxase domain-containing protein [Gammaproteobacteria bacterium SHHR-1]
MMTISPITSIDYYTNGGEDYYQNGQEPQGIWGGRLGHWFGLRGEIADLPYQRIMTGFDPTTNNPLVQNAGSNGHRPGWDCTFSAPKALSVAYAAADSPIKALIQQAQDQAVTEALKTLEAHAAIGRKGAGSTEEFQSIGLLAAQFAHDTSRAEDPQLHTHVLIANLTVDEDGATRSLESRHLYRWQMAAGARYQAALARALEQQGFVVEPDGQGSFSLAGIPQAACDHFSKRASEIEAALAERGIGSSASKAGEVFKLTTRSSKRQLDKEAFYAQWQKEAFEMGVELTLGRQDQIHASFLKEAQAMLPQLLLETLTERDSTFRLQDLYRAAYQQALEKGLAPLDADLCVEQLLESEDCVVLDTTAQGDRIYTSQRQIEIERDWLSLAKALHADHSHRLNDRVIVQAIRVKELEASQKQGRPVQLSEEQKQAVHAACQTGLDIQQGSAGAGKSFSAECIRLAYQAQGYEVIGACIAKLQAENLEKEAGVRSFTLAKLLHDLEEGKRRLSGKSVIIIDEAGLLGVRDQHRLFQYAQQASAKIVLTGEDKQLDAIQHAGGLRYLSRADQIGTARIETIQRQREAWHRQAVTDLREGMAHNAVAAYQQRGLLHFAEGSQAAKEAMVAAWYRYHQQNPQKDGMLIAARWKDVKSISQKVRNILKQEGRVGSEDIGIACGVAGKKIPFEFSTGDRIKFCRNDEQGLGVINGTLGTIRSIQELADGDVRLEVQTDDRGLIRFNAGDYKDDQGLPALALSYCLTAFACQGATVDGNVFVEYDAGLMGRKYSYVTGSRAKDNTEWFINADQIAEYAQQRGQDLNADTVQPEQLLDELAYRMSRETQRKLALDYLQDKTVEQIEERIYEPEQEAA